MKVLNKFWFKCRIVQVPAGIKVYVLMQGNVKYVIKKDKFKLVLCLSDFLHSFSQSSLGGLNTFLNA